MAWEHEVVVPELCELCGRPEAEAPPEQHRCHPPDVCDKHGDCPWCVIACRDAQILRLKSEVNGAALDEGYNRVYPEAPDYR